MTHIAGLAVTIQGRYVRQRCAWCGEVLIDADLATVAVMEGDDGVYPTWTCGAMVEIDDRPGCTMLAHVPGDKLPDDSCAILETTR